MSMSIDPIARRKTYELVAERLVALIGDGSFQSGDQLPTERELTASFNVGRSSVREALRMLESQGVIRSVNGGALVVAEAASPLNSSLRLLLTLDESSRLHDVIELRSILECEAAALAAERRGPEHLTRMDEAIEEMARGLDEPEGDAFIDADLRFHLAVAEATGNRVLLHSMQAVRDVIRRMLMTVFNLPGSAARAIEEHRCVRAAIAAGDVSRARDEMRAHLTRVEIDVRKGGGGG